MARYTITWFPTVTASSTVTVTVTDTGGAQSQQSFLLSAVFDPGTCDDQNGCTTDTCEPAIGCVHTDTVAACDDGSTCTLNDACSGGICSGAPIPPPAEVDQSISVVREDGAAVISWSLATNATSSAVLRGLVSGLPVGPGGADETCLAVALPIDTLQWTDPVDPSPGECFWYLIRGDNACMNGPYGYEAIHGMPTRSRSSSTCEDF